MWVTFETFSKLTIWMKNIWLQWICNGQYGPLEHELKRRLPIPAIIIATALISTLTSSILVYIQRRKLERLENSTILIVTIKKFPNRIPRSLESLLGNFTVVFLMMLTCTGTLLFKLVSSSHKWLLFDFIDMPKYGY